MMLGLNFIGLSYLLVYVGAVSILFLFILMLINVRISELSTDSSNSVPLALVIGVVFTITIYNIIPYNVIRNSIPNTEHTYLDLNVLSKYVNIYDHKDVSFVSTHIWDGALTEMSHITSIGNILYTSYPLWLIITSLILLLAMVGSIIITIKSK
jgi:NADH-ubiquinone oxidoreductase chain 6